MTKPKIAVHKLTSCNGCQLSLLNLEDALLDLADKVEIGYFLEASSRTLPGPYDIAFVEGSVTTPREVERIQEIRRGAGYLVALGSCATAGGIQALRNFAKLEDFAWAVYEHPKYLQVLESSTPLSEHVKVDLELWGCPVNKDQVVEVVAALLQKRRANLPTHSVCLDCKRDGNVCVLVANGVACLGPVTRTGCGALCPANGRGCYGCFGPCPGTEMSSMTSILHSLETYPGETVHLLRAFTSYAPAFRQAADRVLSEVES